MNKPNRAAHEGRKLWTIDPLPPGEHEAPMPVDAGASPARHCDLLASARLAGSNRTIALIGPDKEVATPVAGMTGLGSGTTSAPAQALDPEPGSQILFSHAPDTAAEDPVGDDTTGIHMGLRPSRKQTWLRLACQSAGGQEDILFLRFDGLPPDAATLHRDLSVWPVLRRRCLESLPDQRPHESGHGEGQDAALLWMVLSKIPAAVLVVNAAGLILRMNPQARRLIREGRVLARGRGGLTAASDQGTRLLRAAVKSCLAAINTEHSLLLPTTDGSRVPATLSRFPAGGPSEALVTLMIPVPPEPDQVERVARSLGLTATEARVAALLQRGMSNRVAALRMGVQEQSFATYSKRVLSKLNVTSRAEIAQMLTWQSSLPTMEGLSS